MGLTRIGILGVSLPALTASTAIGSWMARTDRAATTEITVEEA